MVLILNSTKGHVISSGTRIRKDKSVIEKYTVFYAFTKTDVGWKMYAISDVILELPANCSEMTYSSCTSNKRNSLSAMDPAFTA